MEYKYKFSVIVPVYNVEAYLAETLDSVIHQTIGFEENIQLIIVNDGSPDNSADICKKYRDSYPENIVYIEKENGGVSAARNEGMKYMEGKYVNFLDSDDKWDSDAFRTAYDYFEEHDDEFDVLSCRIRFFEAKSGFHTLDYRFNKGTRIVDLYNPEAYFAPQVFVTSVFIKSKVAKNFSFDTRLTYSQDVVYCTHILLEKCKIGLCKEAVFCYRKRLAQTSAIDKQNYNKFCYTELLDYFHQELIDYSITKFGKVIPYVQSVVSYDLMWRFDICETHEVLSDEEFSAYRKKLQKLLGYIDDSIIFGHPNHGPYTRRSVAVNFKYGIDYFKALTLKDNQLYFREFRVFNPARATGHCILNSVSADSHQFSLEILVADWLFRATESGGTLVLKVGERIVKPKKTLTFVQETVRTIDGGEYYFASCVFHLKLKLEKGKTVQIVPYLLYGQTTVPIYFNCTKFSAKANTLKNCRVQGKYKVDYADNSMQISC